MQNLRADQETFQTVPVASCQPDIVKFTNAYSTVAQAEQALDVNGKVQSALTVLTTADGTANNDLTGAVAFMKAANYAAEYPAFVPTLTQAVVVEVDNSDCII